MAFLKQYEYYNKEMADPRTNNWLFVSSAVYPVVLSVFYLYMVFSAIPRYMRNRPAYQLKEYIIVYNLYQVIACIYLTYGIATSGWSHYEFFCQGVDRSDTPEASRMANYVWCIMLIKLSEFTETMVFALRKKHNQISFLHVYHHVSTFLLAWVTTKYVPGGSFTLPIILNNLVHIIMYTYYLLSAFKAPKLQRALAKFKPYITQIQMVQFVLMLLYCAQGLRPSCTVTKDILWVFVPNVFLVFYLFYDFYTNSFIKKNKST